MIKHRIAENNYTKMFNFNYFSYLCPSHSSKDYTIYTTCTVKPKASIVRALHKIKKKAAYRPLYLVLLL